MSRGTEPKAAQPKPKKGQQSVPEDDVHENDLYNVDASDEEVPTSAKRSSDRVSGTVSPAYKVKKIDDMTTAELETYIATRKEENARSGVIPKPKKGHQQAHEDDSHFKFDEKKKEQQAKSTITQQQAPKSKKDQPSVDDVRDESKESPAKARDDREISPSIAFPARLHQHASGASPAVTKPLPTIQLPKRPVDTSAPQKGKLTSGDKKIEEFEAAGAMTRKELQGVNLSIKVRIVTVYPEEFKEGQANKYHIRLEASQNDRSIKINIWGDPINRGKISDFVPRLPQATMICMMGPVTGISDEDPRYQRLAAVSLHFDATTVRFQYVDEPEQQDKCRFAWRAILLPSATKSSSVGNELVDGTPGVPDPSARTPSNFFEGFS